MNVANKKNQWFSSKHLRTFVFDTKKNKTCTLIMYQCRAEYNTDTNIVTVTYFKEGLSDERKAMYQMKRYVNEVLKSPRSIVTVENMRKINYQSTKVQILYFSKNEPTVETMLQLEERIKQLDTTAPFKDDENDNKATYVTEYDDAEYR